MTKKIIISGGGTGGHIFPAIAIANALKQIDDNTQLLFVGAQGRMEMEKVPQAGYPIEGLPVVGIERKLSAKNLKVPFKLWKSLRGAGRIVERFAPDAVVGVGGYASAPVLWAAQNRGIPTLIQEQNSYAGLTNKLLARRARKVCVAYEGMERFFGREKLVLTGNPVRQDLQNIEHRRQEALRSFGLEVEKKTILILGGSLGARTLNQSMLRHLDKIINNPQLQVIWQVGRIYEAEVARQLSIVKHDNVKTLSFIQRMDYAFAAADLVVSRAGAGTISELCVVQKPCILVPSPNVAEDHQTANARALVQKNAAVMIADEAAAETLVATALEMINDSQKLESLTKHIALLAHYDAAREIAEQILLTAN